MRLSRPPTMGQRPNASPGTTHCVSLQRTVLFDHCRQYACAHWTSQRVGGCRAPATQRWRRDARAGRGSCFLAYVGPPCTLRDQVCAGDVRRPHSSIRAASRPQLLMQWRVRHTHRPDCDGEPYTQRLEVPQARRSTSQHIAASVREGRPKPSLTVPSETAHVGRAHAAAKQSRARCGAVNPRQRVT